MAYERKNNSCSLFKNKFKEKDGQPDYKGDAKIDGRELQASAWINTDKNGGKYLKITFEPKEAQDSISQRAQEAIRRPDPISSGLPRDDMKDERTIWNGPPRDDMNDDIPF